MDNSVDTLDWNDTFLDVNHLIDSFPEHHVELSTDDISKQVPPFRLAHFVVCNWQTGKKCHPLRRGYLIHIKVPLIKKRLLDSYLGATH